MNIRHKKALGVTTFLLGVPIIYAYHVYPVLGFLLGFLLSWLAWEDFETKLVDMRVVLAFGLLVILLKGSALSVATGIVFYLFFQCFFYGYAKFDPQVADGSLQDDDPCPLQDGCFTGFVPSLAISAWLYLTIDMIYNPAQILYHSALKGNAIAQIIVQTHQQFESLAVIMEHNPWIPVGIILILLLVVWGLKTRIKRKQKAGFAVSYPMGDGDPYVLGILAAMFGAESFFYVVLMVSMVIGELYRLYHIIYRRGETYE